MHKISDFIKTNKIFILIALIVLMSSFVALNLQYIGKNPFNPQINLDNPVKVCEGKDSFYFISDSSKKISVTDKKFRLKYEIEAGNSDNCFEYADDIAQDSDGNIYVYDRIYSASGSIVKEERIIKFAPGEKNGEILYQTKSIDKSGNAVLKIRGLCIQDGTVYFSEIKNDGIYIYKLENNRAQECRFIKKENAVEIVEDIALNSKMETAVLFKNGDISVYNNTEENYVYKARENDTADYVSLVTEITYDDEDRLYMCDTGLREIYRMSSGYTGKETVISRGKFASAKSDNFSEQPLYTGLSVYGTNVSVLVAEYRYEQETDEEIYTLLENLVKIYNTHYKTEINFASTEIVSYMEGQLNRPGADEFLTPRAVIKDFIEVLDIKRQNPDIEIIDLLAEKFGNVLPVSKDPDDLDDEIEII